MARVTTLEQLRSLIGEPGEAAVKKVHDRLTRQEIDFIRRAPLMIMGTVGSLVEVSPKGDGPGFVEVEDDRTLLIPDRPGNRLLFGFQNLLADPRIGLLFLVPGTSETVRVNGTAEILDDENLRQRFAARGKPATLVVRVRVEECYFHCGKALIRSSVWSPSTWGAPVKVDWAEEIFEVRDAALQGQMETAIAREYQENL